MTEPQLVDYIKKARTAGQADDQSKTLLLKNGWTDAEVGDAFAEIDQPKEVTQPEPKIIRPQMQVESQPAEIKPVEQPQIQAQPEIQPQPLVQQQPQEQTQVKIQRPEHVAQYEEPPQEKKKSHLLLKLFIALIVLLILGGSGYFVAGQYIGLPWNPLNWNFSNLFGTNTIIKIGAANPESVISKAWNNLSSIKSENFNSELLLSSNNIKANGKNGTFNIVVKFIGGVDTANKLADVKVSLIASATDNTANKYNISVSGEGKLIQKDFYLQLNDINLGTLESFFIMFGIDPSGIKGQWIKFQDKTWETQQGITSQVKVLPGLETNMDQNSRDALNKIVKILFDKKAYDIKQSADNQGTEGKEYHYFVSLNQQKIIEASPEIFKVLQDSYAKSNPGKPFPPEYTLVNFQKDINDVFSKIGKMAVDLFIGKTDNFFHKIQIVEDLDISKFTNKADQATGTIHVNYKIEQTGINKIVQVSAPDKYTDFKDFISSFALKSDMNQIGSTAQTVFLKNKSYYSLCKSGLLNGYLKMGLLGLSNDIASHGATKPVCFSSVQDYCVSTQLTDGSLLCVGKSGIIGKVKCVSATTACQ